jgi:hypothetical protein
VTDVLADLVRSLRRRRVADEPPPPPRAPIDVSIQVGPEISSHQSQLIEAAVADQISRRAAELAIGRRTQARVVRDDAPSDAVLVSIDGQPAAVSTFRATARADADTVVTLVDEVDRMVRRRLSILLDPAGRDDHIRALSRRTHTEGLALCAGVPDHLLDLGISLSGLDRIGDAPELGRVASTAELGEHLVSRLAAPSVRVSVPENVLRATAPGDAGALVAARERIFAGTGVQFPDVELEVRAAGEGRIRVRLNDVEVALGAGTGTGWAAVVDRLRPVLAEHAAWLLRSDDVEQAREALRWVTPDLYALSTEAFTTPLLTAGLRTLLDSGESIRNLSRILWLLIEPYSERIGDTPGRAGPHLSGPGNAPIDPELLACHVRTLMAEEARQGGWADARPDGVLIPQDVETLTLGAAGPECSTALWRVVLAARDLPPAVRVVTRSPEAVRPVRRALQSLPAPPVVVAAQEMPLEAALPVLRL